MLRSAQGVVVDAAMLTDPGREPDKQLNEDAIGFTETDFGIAAIVCDGMGGHERGELASHTAVDRILDVLRGGDQPLERLLSTALEQAHAEVYALGGNAPADARPGSTSVILALAGREGLVAHVGDSRAYRIRARELERLTRDHSVVEALLRAGAITTHQANLHPDANRITRALGIAPEIEPELSAPIHLEAGDTFILCSDGLSDLVNELEMGEVVSGSPTPESACQSLVLLANQRGGHDNISVQVLRLLALGPSRASGQTLRARSIPEALVQEGGAPSSPPNTTPSPTLEAEPTLTQEAPESPTPFAPGVATAGLTVAMSTREGVPQTIRQAPNAAPTVLDARTFPHAAPQTLPDNGLRPVPRSSAPGRPPQEARIKLLLWATVGVCCLIFTLILVWWLVG